MCDDKAMPDCERLVAQPEYHIFIVSRTFRCGSSHGWNILFPRMEHKCEMKCSSLGKMRVSIIDMTTHMQEDAHGGTGEAAWKDWTVLNVERGTLPHKTIGR
jgi:hypothetical protein